MHPIPSHFAQSLAIFLFTVPVACSAENEKDRPLPQQEETMVQDPLTIRALTRLEEKMGIQFNIPFPDNFDIDGYRKRPLATIDVNGKKFLATRPIINPYDEPRTVEWMVAPADASRLPADGFDCSIDLDERGEFTRVNLLANWAGESADHLLDRAEGESGPAFFERARITYRLRAAKAKDPALAELLLSGFVKLATTIQALRKEP